MALLTKKLIPAIIFLLLFAGLTVQAYADASLQLQEQEIEAGLLYNFLKYTDWPPHALSGHSIAVCVFGNDPFNGDLNSMAGRSVKEHTITVRYVHAIPDTASCNLLFINADEQNLWPQLEAFLKDKSILTVSDFPGFAASGGMIDFGQNNDHISAVINLNAVTTAHLHVDDRLLKLLTIMHAEGMAEP